MLVTLIDSFLFKPRFVSEINLSESSEDTVNNNDVDDSGNNQVQLSILKELKEDSVHLDDLAYKLNLPISKLLNELRQLESKNLIFFCHRLEDSSFETLP